MMTGKAHALTLALTVGIAHFIFSVIVHHYAASQYGARLGNNVAQGINEIANGQETRATDEARDVVRQMGTGTDSILRHWRVPLFIANLPVRPILNRIGMSMIRNDVKQVISGTMSRESFLSKMSFRSTLTTMLNSLVLGLCVAIGMTAFKRINA
jgi:hypothetical protein